MLTHVNYKPEAVVLDERASFLAGMESNIYSQFGEDGLIRGVLEWIGTENRWCFECGASDGVLYSNTKVLREDGWAAVLIERDARLVADLLKTAANETNSRVVGMEIDKDLPLDDVLEAAGAPHELDLGIIDVDGQDYWLWSDLVLFTPRVMLVECAYRNHNAPIPERGAPRRNRHNQPLQAGLDSIIELGTSKGYRALAATPCNVLFVRQDVIRETDAGQ